MTTPKRCTSNSIRQHSSLGLIKQNNTQIRRSPEVGEDINFYVTHINKGVVYLDESIHEYI